MLHACHERVHRSLQLLKRLLQHLARHGADQDARQAAMDVLRYFDLAAPLHHQDEELHVFPVLLQGTDLATHAVVHRLQEDHRAMEAAWAQARMVLLEIANAPTTATDPGVPVVLSAEAQRCLGSFASLYDQHIRDEEAIAYPKARALLNAFALESMSQDMMRRRGVGATQR